MDDRADPAYDSDAYEYSHVLVVPTVKSGCACLRQQQSKCKCSSPIRSPARSSPCTNYLLKGGTRAAERAAEERAARQEAAAWQDLKVANHALANELVRLQTHGSKEKQTLKEDVARLQLLAQAQQDKMDVLKGRLADALKQNQEAEERHQLRLKELARRLKEEHLSKLRPLQEMNSQLAADVSSKQQESTQLTALREQFAKLSHRLEAEATSRADLRQRCGYLEAELQAATDRLAVTTKSLQRAEQQLERLNKAEQKLFVIEEALQAEQVAHSKLQADFTLEQSQSAVKTAELERLQQELSAVRRRLEQSDDERTSLKLALADVQSAAADAAVEVRAAKARADRLQQELDLTRSEAESQAASLRSQAAAREERLNAQYACRLAQLQSELDAQAAASTDTEASLAAARAELQHLNGQVESLRQLGDAAGNQLGLTQARLEQLQEEKHQQEQQLKAQLQAVQVQLMQREAEVSERSAAAESSGRAWKQERQQLIESVEKWHQKAVQLQEELESRHAEAVSASKVHEQQVAKLQVALDNATAELSDVRKQLAAVEGERTAAAKRSSTLLTRWEERDSVRDEEVAKLRSQVGELLAAGNSARVEADALRQHLKAKELDIEQLTLSLADEQSRLAGLRAQLGALEAEKTMEFETRMKGMQELSTALQAEQQARLEAQLELNRHKKKVANLESEVVQHRTTMNQVLDAKARAEESAATTAAALAAAERKAKQYRGDSTALLSDYDAWVQGLLSKKSTSGSGAAAGPAARAAAATVAGSNNEGGSWALYSPVREGSLSRSTSQLGMGSPGLSSPGLGQQRDSELERYDRIAALLDSRGVGSALTRSVSGKSLSLSPSTAGAVAAALGGRLSSANSKPPSTKVSPRPFK